MTFDDDREQNFPAARKGGNSGEGGGDYGYGVNPGGDPWSAPISPDHTPGYGATGSSVPFTPWNNTGGNFGPSTPYEGGPIPGYAPPPPTSGQGKTTPQGRRRRGTAIFIAFIGVLLAGTLSALLFLRTNDNNGPGTNTGPLAVATDAPTPTPTLLPGQTPLPTRVPTATLVPGAPPPTSVPYAGSSTVTFTAASKNISSARPSLTAATSGGDIGATQKSASEGVGATQSAALDAPQTSTGSQVQFTITVTNHTGAARSAPVGVLVTSNTPDGSGSGNVTCTIITSAPLDPIPNNGNSTQQCIEPQRAEPAASYNATINNWQYTTSGSSPAGGSPAIWTVPSSCSQAGSGDVTAADTAVKNKLQSDLSGVTPGGVTVFFKALNPNEGSAVCTPAAGHQENSSFTYTVSVSGTGDETYYTNSAVQSFESSQLVTAANNASPAGSYQLITSHNKFCSGGGSTSGATSTSVTVSCPSTSVAGWKWSSGAAHSTFDGLITGQPKTTATNSVKAVQGVNASTVSIALSGGSWMPLSGSAITYNIKNP